MLKSLRVIISVPLMVVALVSGASARQRNTSPETAPGYARFQRALLLLSAQLQGSHAGSVRTQAVKEIRAVLDRQVTAWNRGDIEGFMEGYWRSPDLTFFSGNTTVSGWDETLGRYRNRYQTGGNQMGKLEFRDLKIELLGSNAAFVRGRFQLTGSSNEGTGLFTLTLRKLPAGWKIVHDHTST